MEHWRGERHEVLWLVKWGRGGESQAYGGVISDRGLAQGHQNFLRNSPAWSGGVTHSSPCFRGILV